MVRAIRPIITPVQIQRLNNLFERKKSKNGSCSKKSVLKEIQDILFGNDRNKLVTHVINCNSRVFIPENWKLIPESDQPGNRIRSKLLWTSKTVSLYRAPEQQTKLKYSDAKNIFEKLSSNRLPGAQILDYLLKPENQHLIPKKWKKCNVFFLGTFYFEDQSNPCVRKLFWDGCCWNWGFYSLKRGFGHRDYFALAD
jgi:hypothetical protein